MADALGIPHYVLDYEARFAERVIDQFAASYVAGETPIPCVTCNNEIKFRDLLVTAQDLGADVLVTGHYVQRCDGPAGPELKRAADPDRDQSYFLFGVTKDQLAKLWFPLGGMHKSAVRDLARHFNLAISEKADSQDICFVPSGRYSDIIKRLMPGSVEPGNIVHIDGRTARFLFVHGQLGQAFHELGDTARLAQENSLCVFEIGRGSGLAEGRSGAGYDCVQLVHRISCSYR